MHVMEPKQMEVKGMVADASREGEGYSGEQLQFVLGLSLVLGFVFMLLVDQIGSAHMHASPSAGEPHVILRRLIQYCFPVSTFLVVFVAHAGCVLSVLLLSCMLLMVVSRSRSRRRGTEER